MYNGIGLQTARGSGTNGYIQGNKFFVRPKSTGKPVNGGKGFEEGQGTAGLSKKPNKDILEHDRKRQIHLKLAMLEEKLIDQGYSDAEIAQKLEEARLNLEAATSGSEETGATTDAKISDTQTHQIAARKEKQMETFRAALGLPNQQTDEGDVDGEPKIEAYEGAVGRQKERREHSFLDRDSRGKVRLDEDGDEKGGKGKSRKKQHKLDDTDETRRSKKKGSRKRRQDSDDSSDSSDSESDRERRKRSSKKHKGRRQETESDSSDFDSDSDSEKEKRRKAAKKRISSRQDDSSDSEVKSDENEKRVKTHERHRPSYRSESEEKSDRYHGRRREEPAKKKQRHDSDDSESEPENRSDERKKHVKTHERYRPSERSDPGDEPDRYRGWRREEPAKRQRHGSDDSEPEPEDRRQRQRFEGYHRGRKHGRDEEDGRDYKHGRERDRRW
ncbi:PREDICTED: DEAD-box ATP-dependent RNA helicase 42 [Tarenaya hassleriana]|uniref:DEAD-box ATP-dependent RNA helicase 42 n=1 Tax=Tarenaya hassleriana TaxID=28532 RepID=UPI00053C0F49|nr:PREDICTED: DEAD-box ATP-dependent RNA helicase 42 [Tarenaya hassleriana]